GARCRCTTTTVVAAPAVAACSRASAPNRALRPPVDDTSTPSKRRTSTGSGSAVTRPARRGAAARPRGAGEAPPPAPGRGGARRASGGVDGSRAPRRGFLVGPDQALRAGRPRVSTFDERTAASAHLRGARFVGQNSIERIGNRLRRLLDPEAGAFALDLCPGA